MCSTVHQSGCYRSKELRTFLKEFNFTSILELLWLSKRPKKKALKVTIKEPLEMPSTPPSETLLLTPFERALKLFKLHSSLL